MATGVKSMLTKKTRDCNYRVYAKEYKYIGGCYGCGNEQAIMRDVYENGPAVVGFQVNMALMHYSAGVFLQEDMHLAKQIQMNPWEETNHAVLVCGWGISTKGTKYWVVKNSWGSNWGDKGYFYVKRGQDEMAFESMPVSAIV